MRVTTKWYQWTNCEQINIHFVNEKNTKVACLIHHDLLLKHKNSPLHHYLILPNEYLENILFQTSQIVKKYFKRRYASSMKYCMCTSPPIQKIVISFTFWRLFWGTKRQKMCKKPVLQALEHLKMCPRKTLYVGLYFRKIMWPKKRH